MSSPTYTKQEQEPASEEVTEVADGVLRMQLPISLPGLGHVNCYALVDGDGVALVDPGLPGPESWSALMARLKHAEIPVERVHTVVVTHSHPDHFGGSAQLREVASTLRGDPPDPTDLDRDRAKVRETAERIICDQHRPLAQRALSH